MRPRLGSVWAKGGGAGQFLLRVLPDGGLVVFDAQDVVAALFLGDDLGGFFLAVQRVGGDDAAQQVDRLGAEQPLSGGQFVTFVGRGDKGHGGAILMFDEADDTAQVVANRLAVQSQRGGQTPGLGLKPAGEDVGQSVEVQDDEQIAQDGVGGGGIKLRAFLGPEAEGFALRLGQTRAEALDFGEVNLTGQQA